MTIQEAAYSLLQEAGNPMSSKDLARLALDRRMAGSAARDPVQSLAQTLEKNIRGGTYNNPKLKFVHTSSGRLLSLETWDDERGVIETSTKRLIQNVSITLPEEIYEQVQLAHQAKIAESIEETTVVLLRQGLSMLAPKIKEGLMQQLKQL